jgi:hypothetical protein
MVTNSKRCRCSGYAIPELFPEFVTVQYVVDVTKMALGSRTASTDSIMDNILQKDEVTQDCGQSQIARRVI